jgi:hypothetical protein
MQPLEELGSGRAERTAGICYVYNLNQATHCCDNLIHTFLYMYVNYMYTNLL